jgi:hypothetical protein
MSELFKALGMVVAAMWLAGTLGLIDFRLCAKPLGGCDCSLQGVTAK